MLLFAMLASLAAFSTGNVLNNCFEPEVEDVYTQGVKTYIEGEKVFMYLNVEDPDKDIFAINVAQKTNPAKIAFRLAVNCGQRTAKVSRKPDGKKFVNLGERKEIDCTAGTMLIVINNSLRAVWVGGNNPVHYSAKLKGVGQLKLISKATRLDQIGLGCILYPPSVKTCPEALKWFHKHSNCEGDGFINCTLKPTCNGEKFNHIQQIDSTHGHCTTDNGDFVEGSDIKVDLLLGSTADSVCP